MRAELSCPLPYVLPEARSGECAVTKPEPKPGSFKNWSWCVRVVAGSGLQQIQISPRTADERLWPDADDKNSKELGDQHPYPLPGESEPSAADRQLKISPFSMLAITTRRTLYGGTRDSERPGQIRSRDIVEDNQATDNQLERSAVILSVSRDRLKIQIVGHYSLANAKRKAAVADPDRISRIDWKARGPLHLTLPKP